MPALVEFRHNPIVKSFGTRLKDGGLAPKAVIAACMYKLVYLIYGEVKSGIPFNPRRATVRLDFQDGI